MKSEKQREEEMVEFMYKEAFKHNPRPHVPQPAMPNETDVEKVKKVFAESGRPIAYLGDNAAKAIIEAAKEGRK